MTTRASQPVVTGGSARSAPSALALGGYRTVLEVKTFFREKDAAGLLLLGQDRHGPRHGGGADGSAARLRRADLPGGAAHRTVALVHVRVGLRARDGGGNGSRDRVLVRSEVGTKRAGSGHDACADPAVHLRGLLRYSDLPTWLQHIAAIFPLKWMAQGMRSVFLPPEFEAAEVSGSWQHGLTAVVLVLWLIVGLVLCVRTFRWQRRDAG
jgi:hypothetical protein